MLHGYGPALALAAAFALVAALIQLPAVQAWDVRMSETLAGRAPQGVLAAAKAVTELGSTKVFAGVLAMAGGALLLRRRYPDAGLLVASLLGGWGLNTLLKELFRRARPAGEHLVEASGYSFPSGNAMLAIAVYGLLGCWLWRAVGCRAYVIWLTGALTAAVGFSRVLLGVHYPLDIAAGYLAGGAWLALLVRWPGLTRRARS
ncbi:phosphatase PAP2 family protein [Paenibacillus sp. J31TS4]|nr:phosphatase PAP2 family protein [Paenibacillus sp. J31TS4]